MTTRTATSAQFKLNFIQPGARKPYPFGANVDISHGAIDSCLYKYAGVRSGLYHVICLACRNDAILGIGGIGGTIQVACNTDRP
jgi:hypothetical protein